MTYFRERNNLNREYSGFEEATLALRGRLSSICNRWTANGHFGLGNEGWWVPAGILNHALRVHLNKSNMAEVLSSGSYDEVFEAIEIYITIVLKEIYYQQRSKEILSDLIQAFEISGSVYFIDPKSWQINLRVSKDLAKNIREVGEAIAGNKSAKQEFTSAVGGLMSRKESPENVVKGIFVAFEDYLKAMTEAKDYGGAVAKLQTLKLISPTQKSLLEKIYAYRSDTYGVGHAGNNEKPKEVDALWFLETVNAQILLLDRKIKQTALIDSSEQVKTD